MFRSVSRCFSCGLLSVLIVLAGCAGAPSTSNPPTSQVSVSVSPTTVTLIGGATQTFTATVLNDSTNAGVNWTATSGSVTATGVYTAPSPATVATATVTATSKADATKSASATVTLLNPALSIAPSSPAAMIGGATQSFTATVTGDPANAGVKWTVIGGGSFSAASTLSGTATTYTAADPVTSSSATVTATSVTYPSLSASVTVPLTPIALSLTSPASVTLDGDGSQSLAISASITGDASAAGATFIIAGAGGKISAATVAGNSPSATYTAPAVTSASSATVTVGSVKDPAKTQAVAVTLNPPMAFSTPASLPDAALGAAYTGTSFAVTGGTGSKTFALKSGTLPSGLSLSSAGVLSGTPNGFVGNSTFTVSATDQATTPATISATFTLEVGLPQILSSSPSSLAIGAPDSTITLTGTGFDAKSVVYLQGYPQPTTYISSTSLQVLISASNLTYQGSLSLSVSNSGFNSNSFSIPLVYTVPVLSAISPSAVIAGSPGFQLTLTGSNFAYGSTVMINGVSHTLNGQSATMTSVSVAAEEVTGVGSLAVTVVNPTPGGGSSAALQLQLIAADNRVRTLAYSTQDVAVDPVRNLVYASVGSNSATSPNSLLAIDPKQGTVVTTQAVSDQPGQLAITDDGTYLYVSFRSTGEVRRYTLPTLALDIHWNVTGGAVDLETAPGAPHTVAITSPSSAGLTESLSVYDNGVARANTPTGSYPSNSYGTVAWGADASTLYSTNADYSGGPEYIFHVDQSGPTLTSTNPSAFGDFVRRLQFDKKTGLLFEGYGRAVNPATGTLAGRFNVKNTLSYEQNPFTVDSKHSRAFFLNSNSFLPQQIAGAEIQAFDLGGYKYINTLLVPGLSGSRILPWGASGLVVGGGDQVYIIDGPFVAAGAVPSPIGGYAAPSPTLTSLSLQNVRAGSASVDVVVTGSGFTQAALATWNSQTLSSTWQSSTQITVTFPASALTQAISPALTVANGPYQENSNGIIFAVLPDLGPNAEITELNLSGEDMVWDSTHNLLYVAVTNSAALNGNTVAVVDPTNASLLKTIYTGSQPSVLGISDDNHFLYAGFQTSASIQRYLLPDFTLDLTIPLESGAPAQSFAGDIKVAPGQNQTIAVSLGTTLLEPRDSGGLAIFDNAVRRANVLPSVFPDTYQLAWGKDATKLYANSDPIFEPQSFSIISVDGSGIKSRASVSQLTDLGLRPHFDPVTNLVYSDNGRITNPTNLEAAGVLESSGLMVPDAALNRAFFLRPNGNSGSQTLDIFDLRRQSLLKSIVIAGVTGNPTQLVRWGDQGIAFLTDDYTGNGGLYLVQGSDISGLTTAPANAITLNPSAIAVGSAAGSLVTVTGANFATTATIQVNALNRPATYVNSTTLTFTLTAADLATAGYLDITVTNSSAAGTTTPPATLAVTNPAPVISSATPNVLAVGSYDTAVSLTGSGFLPTTTATLNGKSRTATYVSATQLSVLVPSFDLANIGSLALVVSNPAPGGGPSAILTLPVGNPIPTITGTNPNVIATGSAATSVTVFGSGFVPGAVVKVDGAARVTTYTSSSQIGFTLTTADVASSGSVSFSVTNPPPGGGSSAAASIAVNNAQLGPITLSPSVVLTGATPPATITINGTNFLAGATVMLNGTTRTVAYVSSTQLTFQLTTADQATAGQLYVVVANPSPGVGSVYAVLTVTAATATPVISSVSPTQFYKGSTGNYLEISGTGLTSTSVVYWNGNALSTSYENFGSGGLYVTVPDSLVSASGTAAITVSTPSATPSLSNSVSINVVDPIAPTLTSISPNSGPFHTATPVTLTGTNFTSDSVVSINGYAVPTTVTNSTQITMNIAADQLAPGNNIITVNTPAPGGGTSAGQVFTAYVPIANNAMVYNPANQLFYLSVPSAAGAAYGNSIVSIDPVTGVLGNPIFVGSEPNQMAITSDGHSLWVGLDGVGAVRKVDLVANTAGLQFALPTGSSSFMKATALIAVPGKTDSVVVAASQQSNTFSNTSLAVYDSGVARSTSIMSSFAYPAISLQINGSLGEVYAAFQSEYRVYTYDATGLTLKTDFNSTIPVANYLSDRIQLYSGRMYTDYSSAFDAETGVLAGSLPHTSQYVSYAPIAVDPSAGLAFLLNSSQQYSSTPNQIQLANLSDFSATGTVIPVNVASNLYGPVSPVTGLARWGVNGLAFRSSAAVYPLRSVLVKDLSASPADLGVALSNSGPAATGAQQTYLATATNSGPSAASGVALTVTIPSGAVLVSVASSVGKCSTGSVVACSLGGLASGASATVTVNVEELSPGSSTLSARLNASQPDTNLANNEASSTITVTGATYSLAPALTAISPVSVEAGSTDTVITATGQNFAVGATLLADGVALNTTVDSATQLTAIVPASSLATLGWHQLAVVNPAPGGGTTSALTLTVFSVIKAGANRIVYEPFSRQIYATLGSAMPLGNSVEAIDPSTGNMSTPVFIGSEPTRMALSDNGHVLYALASDANEVVRFNTLSQKTEGSFGLQTSFISDNSEATDMAVQPGSGNTVVINNAGAQVVDFDPIAQTSAARSSVLASGLVSPRFLNATDVIGYGDYAFSRFAVTSSGIGGTALSHFTGDASPFKLDSGLAFVNNGTVVDVTSQPNRVVGTFPLNPAYYGSSLLYLEPDKELGRAFFLLNYDGTSTYSAGGPPTGLAVFDTNTFAGVGYVPLNMAAIEPSTFSPSAVDLVRWGQDGIAGLTNSGNIYLVRGPAIVPQLLQTQTAPVLSSSVSGTLTHGSGNTVLTLSGSNFLPGVAVTWNGSYRTTILVDETHIAVDLPASDLAASGTASIVATNPGSAASTAITVTIP